MGVTIRSKNFGIDLGYFGFFRLRRKIAELISEDAGIHYEELSHPSQPLFFKTKDEEDEYWKKYDEVTECIVSKCPKNIHKVFDFLYESDVEGSVTYGTCKQILDVIGDYDDDIIYGYAGRPDAARMKDFKSILEDCVKNKCKMTWY